MTTDHFAAFPDAPTPTSLPEALIQLEETRRLLAEECRKRKTATDELQTIAERVGPAIHEAQIATQERNPGEVARAVKTLVERYATIGRTT